MSEGFYKGEVYKSSADDTWTTPIDFFNKLNDEFLFTLDAAALASSALCKEWFGPDHPDESKRDALTRSWDTDGSVWLNPPYGRSIKDWVAKANYEAQRGLTVVCLVPARTDTNWWWDSCHHHEVRFIKGRLKFGNQPNAAPFPSAVIVMRETR